MSGTSSAGIPHIQLLCIDQSCAEAFEAARAKHKLSESISISHYDDRLSALSANVKFDTVVSPANSYARLDGAFDDAISRAFSPTDDYLALTRVAQKVVYDKFRGFAPPGTCTMIPIPDEFRRRSKNVWGCRRVALCPTMRMPSDACWDREVVYECVWSLLCAIDNHNREEAKKDEKDRDLIESILMTPLATGVGRVSAERWAAQAVLALKHFTEASENPERWSQLDWQDFGKSVAETQLTWTL